MSKVSIVNKALRYLGANKITSLTDGSFEAQCATNAYEDSLRSILSECCWKFAASRVMLNKLDLEPAWTENGMKNYFQLPSDLVEIFGVNNECAIWTREGDKIISNVSSLGIKYVYYLDDTTKYPSAFIDAFACLLASAMCYDITNSNEKMMSLIELYKGEFLPVAKSRNARGASPEQIKDGLWINSARAGING